MKLALAFSRVGSDSPFETREESNGKEEIKQQGGKMSKKVNKKNRFRHWQVSVIEELVVKNGGIEEILKYGIDKRYRDMNCSIEESVLISASRLYNEHLRKWSLKMGYDPRAGFFPGFLDEITRWYNIEFICDPMEVFEDPDDIIEPEIGYGYAVCRISPEQITDIFLVEARGEDLDNFTITEVMRNGVLLKK
jgi:hypothetical protein